MVADQARAGPGVAGPEPTGEECHPGKPASLRIRLLIVSIVALSLLSACQQRGLQIPMDHEFNIEGKLAIRAAKASHSARFRWTQTGEDYRIELWGPLGQGRTILEGDGRKLTVRDGGGKVLESGPVYAVMRKQLGWYLPLEALPQWVQGGPIEQIPVFGPMVDGQGRMVAFDQLGWRLGFTYRNDQSKTPARIRAIRDNYQVLLVLTPPARGDREQSREAPEAG
ncbi:MAG: outer membrane lipoprotein LolB [Gammaproteobacteria bacterium]|nr:outer membrane lipoprotein LolB [Gammaproteobacteria bacterium]